VAWRPGTQAAKGSLTSCAQVIPAFDALHPASFMLVCTCSLKSLLICAYSLKSEHVHACPPLSCCSILGTCRTAWALPQTPYAHTFCTPAQIAMSVCEETLAPSIPTDVPVGIQVCSPPKYCFLCYRASQGTCRLPSGTGIQFTGIIYRNTPHGLGAVWLSGLLCSSYTIQVGFTHVKSVQARRQRGVFARAHAPL